MKDSHAQMVVRAHQGSVSSSGAVTEAIVTQTITFLSAMIYHVRMIQSASHRFAEVAAVQTYPNVHLLQQLSLINVKVYSVRVTLNVKPASFVLEESVETTLIAPTTRLLPSLPNVEVSLALITLNVQAMNVSPACVILLRKRKKHQLIQLQ